LKNMPEEKQVLLFSATMNPQIRRIASNYMRNTEEITVGSKNQGAENVNHFYYVVHEKDRYQVLRRIADSTPDIRAIVFCRTRRETQKVADQLIQDHYSAEAIHGEVSQEQRTHVMNRFKDKKIQLLVATDVAARGIDVSGLTHVINYTLPESGEAYLHRSGRTGRANNLGSSLLIVNMRERHRVRDLERKIGKPFEKGKIPTGEDICERQLFDLVEKISNIEVNEDQIGKYLEFISKKFEDMDRDELIKKIVSVEFNRFIEHYKDAVDLNSQASTSRDGRDGEGSPRFDKSSILFARFKVNIGRDLGMTVKELMNFLNEQPTLRGVEFGDIDISNEHTLFEVDQRYKEKVMQSFAGSEVEGVQPEITCEETGIKTSRPSSGRSSRGSHPTGGRGGRPNSNRRGGRGRDSRSQGGRPPSSNRRRR